LATFTPKGAPYSRQRKWPVGCTLNGGAVAESRAPRANRSALANYYVQKPIRYSRDIELALFSDARLEEPNAVTASLNEAVRAAADRVPTCPAAGRQRKPL
jgi:hypothetical protein